MDCTNDKNKERVYEYLTKHSDRLCEYCTKIDVCQYKEDIVEYIKQLSEIGAPENILITFNCKYYGKDMEAFRKNVNKGFDSMTMILKNSGLFD